MKKFFYLLLILLLSLSFASCAAEKREGESSEALSNTMDVVEDDNDAPKAVPGNPVPTFPVDWPSEMLPEDFPDLGMVTAVYDSRAFIKQITVNWNIMTEAQTKEIVEKLNAYLDYDHAWQGDFYSDGLKYKAGTQDESIRVVVRYMPSASGETDPTLQPQLYLEISGEGIPD